MNLPQHKETLHFRIGVSGLFWDKPPQFKFCINNNEVINSFASNVTQYHEFDVELDHEQAFTLDIWLLNKTDADTVLNDNNEIIKDLLLNIDSIEIDGIELDDLKWSASSFVPVDPARPVLDNCVNLGWNGYYRLPMSSPFYLWLLEKM